MGPIRKKLKKIGHIINSSIITASIKKNPENKMLNKQKEPKKNWKLKHTIFSSSPPLSGASDRCLPGTDEGWRQIQEDAQEESDEEPWDKILWPQTCSEPWFLSVLMKRQWELTIMVMMS